MSEFDNNQYISTGNQYELVQVFRTGNRNECARLIESEEIDINFIDHSYYSRSLIHWACFHGHLDIIQSLLNKGAGIHDKNSCGWSLIMEASRNGYIEIVEFLVSQGANVNDVCKYGWNSLMLASAQGNTRVVKFLLVQGADIYHKSESGKTCIDVATNEPELGVQVEDEDEDEVELEHEERDVDIKSILVNWPIMMVIIVSKELYIYNQLFYSLLELQELQEYL